MKSEWKTVTINDCADIVGDGLHGTPKYSANGWFRFCGDSRQFIGLL